MIRTLIKPESATIELHLPAEYIGKQVEVMLLQLKNRKLHIRNKSLQRSPVKIHWLNIGLPTKKIRHWNICKRRNSYSPISIFGFNGYKTVACTCSIKPDGQGLNSLPDNFTICRR
jgi:hypothetical protein